MVDHPELTDELVDAHLTLAYKSSGLNAMTGEKWDRVVAHRFFALGALFGAGMIQLEAPTASGVAPSLKDQPISDAEVEIACHAAHLHVTRESMRDMRRALETLVNGRALGVMGKENGNG